MGEIGLKIMMCFLGFFFERKKDDFVLQLFISEWRKNKGQNTAIESCRRLVEEEPWEKNLYVFRIF